MEEVDDSDSMRRMEEVDDSDSMIFCRPYPKHGPRRNSVTFVDNV